MKEFRGYIDPETDYWILSIDGKDVMKSKYVWKLVRSFFKHLKSQGDMK